MNITSLVFSPTGGTAKVAKAITAVWQSGTYTELDLAKRDFPYEDIVFSEEDVCYLSFPVFEGRVPSVVLERVGKMKANGARMVMTAVYGNRSVDDALLEMKTAALEMGFRPIAAVRAAAEHSVLRQHASGRPDGEDLAELGGFAEAIRERILSGETPDISVPGKYPYCVIVTPGMKPTADESCSGCGACVEGCPVGAIPADRPHETDHALCIACMRCVSLCPQKARSHDKVRGEKLARKIAHLFEGRKPNTLYL